jgi:hypothetical protein
MYSKGVVRILKTTTGVALTFLLLFVSAEQASAKKVAQTIKWSVTGNCVDLFEEYQENYIVNEGESCLFSVTVKPAKPSRTVALQWFDSDAGKWVVYNQARTNKSGLARLNVNFTDDECWGEQSWEFRIGMARQGSLPPVTSSTFWITKVDDCTDDDYGY